MKRRNRLIIKSSVACALAIFAMLALETTTRGRLAANRLAANRLGPFSAAANSAAASKLAAGPVASQQLGPNRYAMNPETTADFMATGEGHEVIGFIVSCALPGDTTLVAAGTDGTVFEFPGEIGLAKEWLDHPLQSGPWLG